jgi:hypothetical protein
LRDRRVAWMLQRTRERVCYCFRYCDLDFFVTVSRSPAASCDGASAYRGAGDGTRTRDLSLEGYSGAWWRARWQAPARILTQWLTATHTRTRRHLTPHLSPHPAPFSQPVRHLSLSVDGGLCTVPLKRVPQRHQGGRTSSLLMRLPPARPCCGAETVGSRLIGRRAGVPSRLLGRCVSDLDTIPAFRSCHYQTIYSPPTKHLERPDSDLLHSFRTGRAR